MKLLWFSMLIHGFNFLSPSFAECADQLEILGFTNEVAKLISESGRCYKLIETGEEFKMMYVDKMYLTRGGKSFKNFAGRKKNGTWMRLYIIDNKGAIKAVSVDVYGRIFQGSFTLGSCN